MPVGSAVKCISVRKDFIGVLAHKTLRAALLAANHRAAINYWTGPEGLEPPPLWSRDECQTITNNHDLALLG